MTHRKCDGYLAEIQERMDGDVFKAMLEVMGRRVMEEELALHWGAERHERKAFRVTAKKSESQTVSRAHARNFSRC